MKEQTSTGQTTDGSNEESGYCGLIVSYFVIVLGTDKELNIINSKP